MRRARFRAGADGRDPKALADALLFLLASLRGSIFIYQGEELGLPQADVPFERLRDPEAIANWPRTLGRDGARTPMPWIASAPHAGFSSAEPWLPIDPAHLALAVDRQESDPHSTLQVARRALDLRRLYPALRIGDMTMIDAPAPLLVFQRGDGRDAMLCAFNLGKETVRWRPPAGWRIVDSLNLDANNTETMAPLSVILAQTA